MTDTPAQDPVGAGAKYGRKGAGPVGRKSHGGVMESLRGSEIVPVVMVGALLAVWAAHQEARSQRHGRRGGHAQSQWKVK